MNSYKNFRLHKFLSHGKDGIFYNSFFFHRTYFNYLFFTLEDARKEFEFLYSKGGVGKQILHNYDSINSSVGNIFYRFGAAAILPPENTGFHLEVKIEIYDRDFSDKDLKIIKLDRSNHFCWYIIEHMNKKFLILDDSVIIYEDKIYMNSHFCPGDLIMSKNELVDMIVSENVNYILPRCYSGKYYMNYYNQRDLEKYLESTFERVYS